MEKRELGKTGMKVSRIGFGGAPAGLKNYVSAYDPANERNRAEVIEAMHKAIEVGINYFDTAPGYGKGEGERIFGEGLQDFDRSKYFLATKVGSWSECNVREKLEESLKNLRADYVDLLQLHGTVYWPHQLDWIMKKGGFIDQMEALKSEGLVRHIGFTNEAENAQSHAIIESQRFEVLQANYNVMFQHAYDANWKNGSLYEAAKRDMGIISMRSTTTGIFQRWMKQIRPDDDFNYHAPLLQYVLSNPVLDVALVGMRSAWEVTENVAIASDETYRVDIDKLFDVNA